MPWYNGPAKGKQVALVGGPYRTRKAAMEAQFSDSCFASKHWPWTWFDPWFAVKLSTKVKYVTARQAIEHNHGVISNVTL